MASYCYYVMDDGCLPGGGFVDDPAVLVSLAVEEDGHDVLGRGGLEGLLRHRVVPVPAVWYHQRRGIARAVCQTASEPASLPSREKKEET
eukprot:189683-Pyramimonas_sp.AAC.1